MGTFQELINKLFAGKELPDQLLPLVNKVDQMEEDSVFCHGGSLSILIRLIGKGPHAQNLSAVLTIAHQAGLLTKKSDLLDLTQHMISLRETHKDLLFYEGVRLLLTRNCNRNRNRNPLTREILTFLLEAENPEAAAVLLVESHRYKLSLRAAEYNIFKSCIANAKDLDHIIKFIIQKNLPPSVERLVCLASMKADDLHLLSCAMEKFPDLFNGNILNRVLDPRRNLACFVLSVLKDQEFFSDTPKFKIADSYLLTSQQVRLLTLGQFRELLEIGLKEKDPCTERSTDTDAAAPAVRWVDTSLSTVQNLMMQLTSLTSGNHLPVARVHALDQMGAAHRVQLGNITSYLDRRGLLNEGNLSRLLDSEASEQLCAILGHEDVCAAIAQFPQGLCIQERWDQLYRLAEAGVAFAAEHPLTTSCEARTLAVKAAVHFIKNTIQTVATLKTRLTSSLTSGNHLSVERVNALERMGAAHRVQLGNITSYLDRRGLLNEGNLSRLLNSEASEQLCAILGHEDVCAAVEQVPAGSFIQERWDQLCELAKAAVVSPAERQSVITIFVVPPEAVSNIVNKIRSFSEQFEKEQGQVVQDSHVDRPDANLSSSSTKEEARDQLTTQTGVPEGSESAKLDGQKISTFFTYQYVISMLSDLIRELKAVELPSELREKAQLLIAQLEEEHYLIRNKSTADCHTSSSTLYKPLPARQRQFSEMEDNMRELRALLGTGLPVNPSDKGTWYVRLARVIAFLIELLGFTPKPEPRKSDVKDLLEKLGNCPKFFSCAPEAPALNSHLVDKVQSATIHPLSPTL